LRFKRGPFLKVYLALARAGLRLEYLWPALWPATVLAGLFIAAALLDLFAYLPVWLHGGVVLAFLLGFAAALYRAVVRMPRIDVPAARHRIEVNSDLAHRPLTALDDTLAIGADDPTSAGLWQAHLRRMARQSEMLRLRLPRAGLIGRDFWGLRAGLAALLVIGVIAAGGESLQRIGRGLVPPLTVATTTASLELSIWITPPAYTRAAPIVLHVGGKDGRTTRASEAEKIQVPAGSALLAQLAGGARAPDLVIGKQSTPFNRIDANSYHIETELTGGNRLAVKQGGREIGAWPLSIIPDRPPTVEFSGAPEANPQLRLVLPYAASDDYGLKNVTASIRRLDGAAVPDGEDEILVRLPLPGGDRTQATGKSNHDLVSHVWAGLPVLVHLLANDERDATGVSDVEPVVLPERQFSHPVARELYEIRKQMTVKPRDRRLAVLKLDGVADEPKRFNQDSATYLALRIARERLRQDDRERAVADVQRMLWDAALKLEEGRAANANRDLVAAQKALQDALERNASAEEIDRLMNELREAMDKFMSALMQELQDRGELMEMDPESQITDMQDLQQLLDQAQELMRQGSREAAEQLMAELQKMLNNLRGALSQRGGQQQRQMSEAQRQQQREAQEAMREMQDLIRRQEKLLDDTYKQQQQQQQSRRGQQGQPPGQPKGGGRGEQDGEQDLAEQQKELRRRLGELMQKFGEMLGDVPEGLGQAEGAMRESEQALGSGQPGEAIDPENRALEALREGMQQGQQAMGRQMGPGRGNQFGFNMPGGRFGPFNGPRLEGLRPGNRDPFGRQLDEGSNGTATGSVKIPDESEMARAREILDELRRRLGDLWRPEMELEYLKRLLRRF
jgi:uncharacterized protein (TIGR02302 family)